MSEIGALACSGFISLSLHYVHGDFKSLWKNGVKCVFWCKNVKMHAVFFILYIFHELFEDNPLLTEEEKQRVN